jgi:sialic acid synthase SpsE
MTTPYIIAEAAQGYEGNAETSRLLVRAAKAGGADAIKFQMVWANDLCEPGYQYRDLFQQLEMSEEDWGSIIAECHRQGLAFVADIFGPRSLEVSSRLGADAYKIHSTCFFDDVLVRGILGFGKPVYLSVGGIEPQEITDFLSRHHLDAESPVVILYGYQAEPTPIDGNNLDRIASLRALSSLEIGFMDHSDGGGEDWLNLSLVALGKGVRVFEKHITLDYALEMEDYVSALGPRDFRHYSDSLRRLAGAFGSDSLALSEAEVGYRGRALKRVVAARDLSAGQTIMEADLRLNRPAESKGLTKPREAIGRTLKTAVPEGHPITEETLS